MHETDFGGRTTYVSFDAVVAWERTFSIEDLGTVIPVEGKEFGELLFSLSRHSLFEEGYNRRYHVAQTAFLTIVNCIIAA